MAEPAAKLSSSESINESEKVFTEIVEDVQRKTLQAVIRGRVGIETIIHSDSRRGYNGLVDLGYPKHFRVNRSADEFANDDSKINRTRKFLVVCRTTLAKVQWS